MLLSGNGRHRRPRPAPKFVVAAGVTGAGMAIPLLAASVAQAASTSTWDKVAECESGGEWSTNTGNGHYGGLQFSQATWALYGGLEFAQRPDLASRSQQIAVAERVLAEKGAQAWAACSVGTGLAEDDEAADVDVVPDPAESSTASPPPKRTESTESTEARQKAKDSDEPSRSAETERQEKPGRAESAEGNGQYGQSRENRQYGHSDLPGQNGRSASSEPESEAKAGVVVSKIDIPERGGDAKGASTDNSPNADGGGYYTVVPGDSLSGIANATGHEDGWRSLYEQNKGAVGGNPDLIRPGQQLELG